MECVKLMIVVAIIGILAAVALPAYKDYTIRAKVSEAVLAGSACRTAITEVFQSSSSGSLPGAGAWGCESVSGTQASKYVASVTTDTVGKITITTSADPSLGDAASKTIEMQPWVSASAAMATTDVGKSVYQWKCGPGKTTGIAPKYLPGSCRDTIN